MKPTVMMGEKPPVVVSELSFNDRPKSAFRKRTVLVTVGLVLLCSCGLFLGLFFGLKGQKSTVVVKHVYFKSRQGELVPADVLLTQNEEIFSLENQDIVYDFSTGLTVYRSKLPGEMEKGCLVESFNMTEAKKPSDLKSELENDQIIGLANSGNFRVTNVWLNNEALGPKSQDLCADVKIRFIERVGDGGGTDNKRDIEEDPSDLDVGYALREPKIRRKRWTVIIVIG